jgi:hypothetical protein
MTVWGKKRRNFNKETGESESSQVMTEKPKTLPVPGVASRLRPALPPKVPDPSLPACRPRFMGKEGRGRLGMWKVAVRGAALADQRVGAGSPVILLCGRRVLTGERRLGPLISTPQASRGD